MAGPSKIDLRRSRAGNESVIRLYDVLCLLSTYVPAMVENGWRGGSSRWLRPSAAWPGAGHPWNNKGQYHRGD